MHISIIIDGILNGIPWSDFFRLYNPFSVLNSIQLKMVNGDLGPFDYHGNALSSRKLSGMHIASNTFRNSAGDARICIDTSYWLLVEYAYG